MAGRPLRRARMIANGAADWDDHDEKRLRRASDPNTDPSSLATLALDEDVVSIVLENESLPLIALYDANSYIKIMRYAARGAYKKAVGAVRDRYSEDMRHVFAECVLESFEPYVGDGRMRESVAHSLIVEDDWARLEDRITVVAYSALHRVCKDEFVRRMRYTAGIIRACKCALAKFGVRLDLDESHFLRAAGDMRYNGRR